MLWSRISFRLSVRRVVSTVIWVGSAWFYFLLRPIWARALRVGDDDIDQLEDILLGAHIGQRIIFHAFGKVDDMAILRVKREEEFAPVKNADSAGVDCPRTARELYKKFYNLD